MPVRKMADVMIGARKVFFRCGYEGATVDAIAAEGKVSKATMYSYYPTKEQLFLSVVESECGRLADEILRPLIASLEPRAQLEELALRMVDLTLDDTYIRLLRTCIGASEALPEVGEVYFRAGPKPARELVGQVLERLTREGALDVDDARRASDHFIHLCVSGLLMPRLLAVKRPVHREKHAGEAVAAFLRLYGSGHRDKFSD
ncbi:TetR family transcriptional regulator [Sulfitobacter sp. HI0040]|jgi:TetR/AcrR family transcriptional repressor of mexJK operon|nr:TetR/AcrR family transcriptional regulator [Sulfitobacter sp. HI0040]KZY04932.1 TetR family transcriptional regulator [Sulfitobacter sp. HI0023]KZY26855.1 TetR family transcriptional regulator [Sulfitobacter sp. HI0040]